MLGKHGRKKWRFGFQLYGQALPCQGCQDRQLVLDSLSRGSNPVNRHLCFAPTVLPPRAQGGSARDPPSPSSLPPLHTQVPARARCGHGLARIHELFCMTITGSASLRKNNQNQYQRKGKYSPIGKCIFMWKPRKKSAPAAAQLLVYMRSSVGRFDHSCCCTYRT